LFVVAFMIRIVLACEGGSGIGHVVHLKSIAQALGPAFEFDGFHFHDEPLQILASVCDDVFRCPAMMPRRQSALGTDQEHNWCWANYLEVCGFGDPAILEPQLAWWRDTLQVREADLVICDYATTAVLAAKTLGIPTVITGTALSVPPENLRRFPAFADHIATTLVDETAIVDAISGVLGMDPIRCLPDIYKDATRLPCGIDFLDPYQGLRSGPLLPPAVPLGNVMAGEGKEIFVYLSHVIADPSFMLEALSELGAPVRAKNIIVEDKLLKPEDIARRSRLMVAYGQPATVSLALALGLPIVAFPQHLEQSLHAERAARAGGLRFVRRADLTRELYIATIREAYHDETLLAAARQTSPRVRAQFAVDVPDMIRETLRPALVSIIKRKGLA
jgi:hypothetical protein